MSKIHKKIFVIGFCDTLTDQEIKTLFKKEGFENEVECITGKKLKNTVADKHYTKEYAEAVFVGPMPHKVKNSGDANSYWDFLLLNKELYPPVIKVGEITGCFKITRSSLLRAIVEFLQIQKAS